MNDDLLNSCNYSEIKSKHIKIINELSLYFNSLGFFTKKTVSYYTDSVYLIIQRESHSLLGKTIRISNHYPKSFFRLINEVHIVNDYSEDNIKKAIYEVKKYYKMV